MPDEAASPEDDKPESQLVKEQTADGPEMPDGVVPVDEVDQSADPVEGSPV